MTGRQLDKTAAVLTLYIQPDAKKTEVAGLHGESVKIRLAAPPVDGKANARLRRFLADRFDVPLSQVELGKGQTSREKRVRVLGSVIDPREVFGF